MSVINNLTLDTRISDLSGCFFALYTCNCMHELGIVTIRDLLSKGVSSYRLNGLWIREDINENLSLYGLYIGMSLEDAEHVLGNL